jgi:hypothetical protein
MKIKYIIYTLIDNIMKQHSVINENVTQLCQLVGVTRSSLKAFKNMKQDSLDAMIIYVLVQKLDRLKDWELQISAIPAIQLYTFFLWGRRYPAYCTAAYLGWLY